MIPDVAYRFTIRPLPEHEGGGYLIEFPDLPGCISDGLRMSKRSPLASMRLTTAWAGVSRERQAHRKARSPGFVWKFQLWRGAVGSIVGLVGQIECSGRAFDPLRMTLPG